jgi:anaerobic magnesium-protoporphyrin IX monomethyl ester cyclase
VPRIALITPPSQFLLDERVFVSLGILKIGAVLENAGYQVDHLDLSGVENYEDVVRAYSGASLFGLTATTAQMPAAIRIATLLREKPGSKIILGGPHGTLTHAAAKKHNERAERALSFLLSNFDCIVCGDGESAVFQAIHGRGVIDADDPKSPLWLTPSGFNQSPWPARHLVDIDSYHYSVDGRRALSLIGQLGCPYHCSFCGGRNSPSLRNIRLRTSENVVAELMHLHDKYGVSGCMMLDDELNVNKQVLGLMRQIAATGVDWRLRGFVKANLFTEEQAEAMYAAGFRWLLCGFESAHPRILHNIQKMATMEQNTEVIRIAHKYGLKVKALMSFGHPGDSEATLLATRDWLMKERPDDFDVTVITVYPGTPYYDESKMLTEPFYRYEVFGDVLYSESIDFTRESQYYKGAPGEYRSYVWTDYLSRERMVELRDEVEDQVRRHLGLSYPSSVAALRFESSMGQSGIPSAILRSSSSGELAAK